MSDAQPPFVVALEGASNLRDLGGYDTSDGRRTRRGLVFRSAALARLTEADQAAVAALGLRVVCDFRGAEESARTPCPIASARRVPVPIEPTVGAGLRDLLQTAAATGEALRAVLERAYVAYALSSQAQYRQVFNLLLSGETPLLFHCSAGKDRTGFGAAALLLALGVEWETVVADFTATNRLWRRDTVPADDLPPEIRQSLMVAEPDYLKSAFDAAAARYGSLDGFFSGAYGLDQARREKLRDLLLESA